MSDIKVREVGSLGFVGSVSFFGEVGEGALCDNVGCFSFVFCAVFFVFFLLVKKLWLGRRIGGLGYR